MSRVVWLLGAITVVSALVPAWRRRVEVVTHLLPPFAPEVATGAALAAGLALLWVAKGLRRRKHRAWGVAVAQSGSATVLHLAKGLDYEEASLAGLVLGALLLTASCFTAAADPLSRRTAWLAVATVPTGGVLVGTVFLAIRRDHLVGHVRWPDLVVQAAAGLVGVRGPLAYRFPFAATETEIVLGVLGGITLLTLLAALLRAGGAPPAHSSQAAQRVRGLLEMHGDQDSLGYFALRDDKSLIFSPTGKAAIAYRVVAGVCLASGDPLGDVEAWPGAIQAWLDQAREHAWRPAVLAASERGATVWRRYGFDALELGDEAIVDVDEFTLAGREMRAVRQAANRVERNGTTVEVTRLADLDATEVERVRALAAAWRDGGAERGFSMALGRLGDPDDGGCVLVRAFDASGGLRGLLHLVPCGQTGLSLDLMRRDPEADNGITEFMITQLISAASSLGVRQVSLNFAVFRSVFARGERIGAGPVLRLWRRVLLEASRLWQIESLYRANAKYRPHWHPRFVCFDSARDLPRVGLAMLHAEAFLTWPRWLGGRHRSLA
jgi:lysyl-tRNA synthetase class 2